MFETYLPGARRRPDERLLQSRGTAEEQRRGQDRQGRRLDPRPAAMMMGPWRTLNRGRRRARAGTKHQSRGYSSGATYLPRENFLAPIAFGRRINNNELK